MVIFHFTNLTKHFSTETLVVKIENSGGLGPRADAHDNSKNRFRVHLVEFLTIVSLDASAGSDP